MKEQTYLVKGATDFLDEVTGSLKLILLAKETKARSNHA